MTNFQAVLIGIVLLAIMALVAWVTRKTQELPVTNVDSSAKTKDSKIEVGLHYGAHNVSIPYQTGDWHKAHLRGGFIPFTSVNGKLDPLEDLLKKHQAGLPQTSPLDSKVIRTFMETRSIRKTSEQCHVHTKSVAKVLKDHNLYHLVSFVVMTEPIRKDVLRSLLANKDLYDKIYDAFYGRDTNEQVAQVMGVPESTIEMVWDAMCEDPVPDREAFYARNGSSK